MHAESDDKGISIWIDVWSLGRNHPECVWSVQLSLAVSYGRKASRWLIQFTLCPLVEERIWHDTKCHSIDAFPNKGQKNGCLVLFSPPSSLASSYLFPSWQAHWIRLVFHIFVKCMVCIWPGCHGFSSCMGQDMCLLYIWWDAEKIEGRLECWCPLVPHSSVWDFVFYML